MNKNLDLYIVYQFLKKLSTPFKDWKAFDLGIIDEKGNVLKSRDQLTDKELKDWTYFDLLVTNIKKLISAIPAGNQKMANMVMALYLTKEYKGKKAIVSEPGLKKTQGQVIGYARMKEQHQLADILEQVKLNEDGGAPVNSAGSGNVAGIGVGPQGEPGVKLAMIRRYIKKNKSDMVKYANTQPTKTINPR